MHRRLYVLEQSRGGGPRQYAGGGVRRSAEVFGERSSGLRRRVKGMEQSGYETHCAPSMLLAYMTCDVGAHHNRAWAITYDLKVGREAVTPDKAAK